MRKAPLPGKCATCVAMTLTLGCHALFGQQAAKEFRLPHVARPTHYNLELTILPDQPSFRGVAKIAIELEEKSDAVWLDAKDLEIAGIQAGPEEPLKPVKWQTSGELLKIELGQAMRAGPLQLAIQYAGKLDDKSPVGAYRRKSANDWYVFTAFTPIDARRAFPCFDEPEYKAPWEFVLHVKRDQVAVTNAPEVSTTEENDGMKRVAFAPTQPLPSEVIAFAVGPFDVVDAGVAGQKRTPVRIITPRGRAADAGPASKTTAEILPQLEQYTGIPYPWDKLDHIALLDIPFGAIENPGLITYREDELLAAPSRDTQPRQHLMRGVMTHEMSHQWFGNLVTQAWWNDVWLSEGFATWLERKISETELPPFERGLRAAALRNSTILPDSTEKRPVRLEMHTRKEMNGVYDATVYVKGASILEMLENWIGPAEMRRSLHRYLTDHAFGNATTEDLVEAFQQETGVDVSPVLFGFLDCPGAPTLRFSMETRAGNAKLNVEQADRDHPWAVPVCIHLEDRTPHCEVVSGAHAELSLAGQPEWLWPNAYGSGYYRSALAKPLLDAVLKTGYLQMEGPERLGLVGDLEGLASTGHLPAAPILDFLPRLAKDSDPHLAARAYAIALEFSLVTAPADRKKYATWLNKSLNVPKVSPGQSKGIEEFFKDKP